MDIKDTLKQLEHRLYNKDSFKQELYELGFTDSYCTDGYSKYIHLYNYKGILQIGIDDNTIRIWFPKIDVDRKRFPVYKKIPLDENAIENINQYLQQRLLELGDKK